MRRASHALVVLGLSALLMPSASSAVSLSPGDFVMLSGSSTSGPYSVVVLDGSSTAVTEVTSGGYLSDGATDIAATRSGVVLVTAQSWGVVIVNPATGAQTIFASLDVLGPGTPSGITAAPDGAIYVSMQSHPSRVVELSSDGALVRVVTSGGFLPLPAGLVVGGDGALYVCATIQSGAGGGGGIVRVDLATGSQTPIASNALLIGPFHIALAPDGWLWTVQYGAFAQRRNGCVVRTRTSDGYSETVPFGQCTSQGIAIRSDGTTVVGDCYRVNGDCGYLVTYEYPSGNSIPGVSGAVTVVPDPTTTSSRSSWGRLKTIYR